MYGKLFAALFTGSLYGRSALTFAVWAWIIANHYPDRRTGLCFVEVNPLVLAGTFATTPDAIMEALAELEDVDPASRSPAEEGRRIVLLTETRRRGPMQYRIVNGHIYRAILDEESRRTSSREAKRRTRAAATNDDQRPARPKPKGSAKPDPEIAALWAHFVSRRSEVIPRSRPVPLTPDRAKAVAALLAAGYTADDVRAVIDHYAERARAHPSQGEWLNPTTPFRLENFARTLGMIGAPEERKGRDVRIGWGRPPEDGDFPTVTGEVKL